jgi:hypothetical protein
VRLSDLTCAYWTTTRGGALTVGASEDAGAGESRANAVAAAAVSARVARRASDGFMLGSFCRDPAPILLLARNIAVTAT